MAGLVLLASSPFAVRYATEARMYSLVTLLVFAGWLLVRRALDEPRPARLVAVALVSGLLLLTHYWAFYLVPAAGAVLAWAAWRHRSAAARRVAVVRVAVALGAGGLLFLPWLPGFLYQSAHTGTPWAAPTRPAGMLAVSLDDLGGGGYGEAAVLGMLLAALVVLGLVGAPDGSHRVVLDLRTRARARPEAAVLAATLALAAAGSYLTGSAFATRYVSALLPLVVLLGALGVVALPRGPARLTALALVAVLGLAGGVHNARTQRTQGGEIGRIVAARAAAGDVVAFCPDQLGPAVARHLPAGLTAMTYPTGRRPERVDWVDYEARHAAAEPRAFAARVLDAAGGNGVWLVWAPGYRTLGTSCTELRVVLAETRPSEQVVAPETVFEGAELVHYPAP